MANKPNTAVHRQYAQELERLAMSPPCLPEMRDMLWHLLVAQDYELWVGDTKVEGLLSMGELSDLFINYSNARFQKDEKGRIVGACLRYGKTDHYLLYEKNDECVRFAIC